MLIVLWVVKVLVKDLLICVDLSVWLCLYSACVCVCVLVCLQEQLLSLSAGWAGEAPGSNSVPAEGERESFVVPKSTGFLPLTV